ncbi:MULTISPECIES: hypothetical protein [unclassified Methylophaga]|jgi:hypothetical protein|uniref:baseplate complex protein n=2 Tax=Methylophaga TaxID=40222 RepID=UPI00259C8A3E|nr:MULTISPECIES: hypothetical protein [unclassified Methylophaga]|tara:strand:+ start:31937 stop:32479 length:543 start_codon:yes stop_codon:yes gene_type:complete
MSIRLGGEKLNGKDFKVSSTLTMAGADLSGQTSYTDTAETGDKPKQLSVRYKIPFKDKAHLQQVVRLAEAKDTSGNRMVYTIVNITAEGMGIRQVKFEGDLSASEDESLNLWSVSFKLTEVRSVPELKESRQEAKTVTDQVATGDTVLQEDTAVPDQVELTSFENILNFIDKHLPDSETA